ncbi:hypothetical protein N9Z79_01930 [Akkermansiaceae bacterium]|nr:hypothetical protein [Akkermansiaceae bacterium]
MEFATGYDFLEYLYDNELLQSVEIDADGGYGGKVDCEPKGLSEQVEREIFHLFFDEFPAEMGIYNLSKDAVDGLISKTSLSDEVHLWNDVSDYSAEIMMKIADFLKLPHELFEVTRRHDPRIFVHINMYVKGKRVADFEIRFDLSYFCSDEFFEDYAIKVTEKEIEEKISSVSKKHLSALLSEYILSIDGSDGFYLSFSEYSISQLVLHTTSKILFRKRLGRSRKIKIENLLSS